MSASSHVRATLRIYAESYEKDPSQHNKEPQVMQYRCSKLLNNALPL